MKKINKYIFIIAVVLCSSFVVNRYDSLDLNTILAGQNYKQWNITDNYPKNDTLSECDYPNSHSTDNTWEFKRDNTFSFHPGLIVTLDTISFNCHDPHPFSGTWEFMDNETKVKLVVLSSENLPVEDTISLVYNIEKMAQDTMILNDNDNYLKYVFTTK